MRWDGLFRAIVIGGAALGGGITQVGCTTDSQPLQGREDAAVDDRGIPHEGPVVLDGGRDAQPSDVPREGPDIGPRDTGAEDVPREGPPPPDAGFRDADPPDVPREGPDIGPPPPPEDSGIEDSGQEDSGIPHEGPVLIDAGN